MALPDLLPIKPFTVPALGDVTLPGSKSLTNRALLLAALSDTPVTLTGALFSEDTHLMAEALRQLGFTVVADEAAHTVTVSGQENGFRSTEPVDLFVGLAGTAARFLTALCAAAPRGVYRIDGVPQMRKRPMKGLIDALRELYVDIRCTAHEGFFPIEIHAKGLKGGPVVIDARESSQMLSALLMVAPLADQSVEAATIGGVRWPFVHMTARLMEQFGQPPVQLIDPEHFQVIHGTPYSPAGGTYAIEPDATAASYFTALPLVTGGQVLLRGFGGVGAGLQGDTAFITVLEKAGLVTRTGDDGLIVQFKSGDARTAVDENFNEFSDTFLTLAAISPLLDGPTTITGIAHSRKQETDRVAGMARELIRLGQHVIETEDSLVIHPRPLLADQVIETYGDHRFAMSFGILGCHDLHGDGRPWLTIRNPACCGKTFPHFFDVLSAVREDSLAAAARSPLLIVAIDGGAASGKSSTSRAVSERFNLLHVDTGSYYRAITAELINRGLRIDDLGSVGAALPALTLATRVEGRAARMEIGGRIVAESEVRSPAVNAAVSHFAAIPELRAALLAYQRGQVDVARAHGFRGLVMEGRDIGSVIFPNADLRFFLHADPEERARRRAREGQQDSIVERDRLDSSRKASPLTVPAGAVAIDSTDLTLAQVVEKISADVAARLG